MCNVVRSKHEEVQPLKQGHSMIRLSQTREQMREVRNSQKMIPSTHIQTTGSTSNYSMVGLKNFNNHQHRIKSSTLTKFRPLN